MSTNKEYSKPSLTTYGAAEEITQQGNAPHQDQEGDNPNTAYS